MARRRRPPARSWRSPSAPPTLARLEEPLGFEPLHAHAADRDSLYTFCRSLVGAELQGGMREELLQALTTLVYSVPSGAAAVVTVATGGMGHDAVIWAGTLLSTPLLERFVDLLGADVRAHVTQKWAEAHGATLARALEERFFSGSADAPGHPGLGLDAHRRDAGGYRP